MTDPEKRSEIEKKATFFNSEKERLNSMIDENINASIKNLENIGRDLHARVEAGFSMNPFSESLAALDSGASFTNEEVDTLLAQDVPAPFGQNRDLFARLRSAIESLKSWEGKNEEDENGAVVNPLELIPKDVTCKNVEQNAINLSWSPVKCDCYEIELKSLTTVPAIYHSFKTETVISGLKPGTEYNIRVRAVVSKTDETLCIWSNPITVQTEPLYECAWKGCPNSITEILKYRVDSKNPRIAIVTGNDNSRSCSIIMGDKCIPLDRVTSWTIKVLNLKISEEALLVGVIPSDAIIHGDSPCWVLNPCTLSLFSGPPHNYEDKIYGPRNEWLQSIRGLESVGVVMDTTKGDLSFALNGVDLGVAYEGIPLDKPLVPCVFIKNQGDAVELDFSEKKENIFALIPVPSNIVAKSTTWDSITLTWDAVEGASFYQVEVNGSKILEVFTTNAFTKRGLPPDTEYTFRVRVVKRNSMGKWSDVVKERTQEMSLESGWWKSCPSNVDEVKKYVVDEKNPRIVTKTGDHLKPKDPKLKCHIVEYKICTAIWNTHLPLNKVTSWYIKVLKSKDNYGNGINIGVAPSDIDQNEDDNYDHCGWYFNCAESTLCSGLPHKYDNTKEYGPRKGRGEYVHTGGSVGVVMDTTKGELSFVVNGVNLGVAYEGIPLDKPLVPCVLCFSGDSVELDTSEVKETVVDSSIPVPSNITAKSITWDSITLTWDAVEGASFYQIEVDGSKFWGASTTNTFTKKGFLAETEHSFRVRTVRLNSVSEWSCAVKGRAQKESFETSSWKECPNNVDWRRKYSVDEKNPRVATYIGGYYCTIIGNTALPLNQVTSWNIKILNSIDNNGSGIYIGVAPFDVNQNGKWNCFNCGWYFRCYTSTLFSGPPHNYNWKEYGPRKEKYGQYVHTGDSVGVVMDTTRGDLSFALNGVNHGVAYEGIPLGKPLVPCVILLCKDDSIELVI